VVAGPRGEFSCDIRYLAIILWNEMGMEWGCALEDGPGARKLATGACHSSYGHRVEAIGILSDHEETTS
jgi:hypothetical protein